MISLSGRSLGMAFLAGLALLLGVAIAWLPPWLLVAAVLACLCLAIAPLVPLAMLIALLTLAPLRSLIATETDYSLPLDIGQLLLLLYLGLWLAHRMRQRRPLLAWRGSLPLSAAVCLCAVFALGAWQAASPSHWLREWLKWLGMALLIWNLSLSQSDGWRWLILAIVLSAAANALVGLYIFFGGSGADHLLILGRFYRAFGTFGQPNPFGGFMGIALPVALMCACSQCQRLWRAWRGQHRLDRGAALCVAASCLACLLIAAGLLASWSRGAWLGAAVALLAMLIALPRRVAHGVLLALLIAALVAVAWSSGLLPDSIVSRITSFASDLVVVRDARGVNIDPDNFAVIERLAHWQAALNMAADAPLLGAGLGSYEPLYTQYRLINWEAALGHAHNHYLNMLAETGALGLAAYVGFWLAIIAATWHLRRHPDRDARFMAVGMLGSWLYIATHSLFDKLFVNNLFLHIGVLLAVLAILRRQLTHSLELD